MSGLYCRGLLLMYESFNSQSKNIGDLLGGNERARIVVPVFQRGYSWEKKHVEAFWTDIMTFQKESTVKGGPDKYFLGPIVILPESKSTIRLLDGQQRLATATILFAILRDVARELVINDATDFARDTQAQLIFKDEPAFALELGEMDELYFKETIQRDPPSKRKPTLRSHRNIQKAHEFLMASVKAAIGGKSPAAAVAWLRALRQMLRSDLVMSCIPVTSDSEAFRIFETLNDRGLRLSVPDLLLNYLMRVAPSDAERRQIRDYWNEMLEQMGRRDINRFLRHMWVSKYGDLKSIDLFTALKQHIEANSIASLDFTKESSDECLSYVQLLDADEKRLGKAAPLVRTLMDLDFESALPLLLSGLLCFDDKNFEKLVHWLIVFVTRYSVISRLDSSGLESVLFKIARQIRTTLGITKDAKKTRDCLATIKIDFVKNAPPDDQLILAAEKLMLSPAEAKYLVGRIATYMQTGTKEVKLDEANLEHIFPKSPNEQEWKKDKDELEEYLWHLGNLTMLGERLNRNAANRGYSIKRAEHYLKSELEMARRLAKDYNTWNKGTVEQRAKKLSPETAKLWNFDNPSRI